MPAPTFYVLANPRGLAHGRSGEADPSAASLGDAGNTVVLIEQPRVTMKPTGGDMGPRAEMQGDAYCWLRTEQFLKLGTRPHGQALPGVLQGREA